MIRDKADTVADLSNLIMAFAQRSHKEGRIAEALRLQYVSMAVALQAFKFAGSDLVPAKIITPVERKKIMPFRMMPIFKAVCLIVLGMIIYAMLNGVHK